jgi:hypothetical protein
MTDHRFKVGDRVRTIDGEECGTVVRIVAAPEEYTWPVVVEWDGVGGRGHFRHSELLPARKFKTGDRVERDVAWWKTGVVADPAYSEYGKVRVIAGEADNDHPLHYSEDALELILEEEKEVDTTNRELEEYKKKVLAVALRTKNDPNVTFCESGFKAAMEELGLPYGPPDEYDEGDVLEILYDHHRVIALKNADGWRYFRTENGAASHQTSPLSWESFVEVLQANGLDLDDADFNVIA